VFKSKADSETQLSYLIY